MYLCSNSEGTFLFENYPMRRATVNRKHVHHARMPRVIKWNKRGNSLEVQRVMGP
jgi:hypothetical protein